ncbi:DUF2970 domain-containing protein [Alteromonadaceae bacterium M269]|nr:DUF2970 domain-containing protein [Alteromonadaceae bacterium M269]
MKAEKASLWQVIKSVSASMFGVQSEKNRQLDFAQTSIVPYVVVGVIFVAVLVVSLAGIVQLIAN